MADLTTVKEVISALTIIDKNFTTIITVVSTLFAVFIGGGFNFCIERMKIKKDEIAKNKKLKIEKIEKLYYIIDKIYFSVKSDSQVWSNEESIYSDHPSSNDPDNYFRSNVYTDVNSYYLEFSLISKLHFLSQLESQVDQLAKILEEHKPFNRYSMNDRNFKSLTKTLDIKTNEIKNILINLSNSLKQN